MHVWCLLCLCASEAWLTMSLLESLLAVGPDPRTALSSHLRPRLCAKYRVTTPCCIHADIAAVAGT